MAANKSALRLGFKKFSDKLAKKVVEVKSRRIQDALGIFVVDLIRKRTRLGYGINKNGGDKVRFPQLSDRYVDYRKKNRRELDPTTSAKKSNVTFSGQMLRSLGYRIKGGNSGILIQVSGTRRDGSKNEDVALELLNKRDRRFIGLTRSEERQVARLYRQQFGKVIRKRS